MSRNPGIPGPEGVPSAEFQAAYDSGEPAWCIDRAQPVVVEALERGWLSRGPILDAGCGTGENLRVMAERRPGLDLIGADLVSTATIRASEHLRDAGLEDRVQVFTSDLRNEFPAGPFESILDAGVLHVFSDHDRSVYLRGLRAALVPGGELVVIVFSDAELSPGGPRRYARAELENCLEQADFRVTDLESCRYQTIRHDGGARAWLLRAIRI